MCISWNKKLLPCTRTIFLTITTRSGAASDGVAKHGGGVGEGGEGNVNTQLNNAVLCPILHSLSIQQLSCNSKQPMKYLFSNCIIAQNTERLFM